MARLIPGKPENSDILSLTSKDFGKKLSPIEYMLSENYLTHSLSDDNAVKNGLTNYLFTLSILEDALDNFLKHKYRMFDALVGNNTCYSVGYAIFLIAYRSKKNSDFNSYVKSVVQEISLLKNSILKELDNTSGNIKLSQADFQSFLQDKHLVFSADLSLVYLFLAFGCSIAKRENEEDFDEINYDSILLKYNSKLDIKKKSIIKLVKHWQKCISVLSVNILQNNANSLNYPEILWARYIFDPYILEDERKRLCTSSLFSIRVIYNMLLTMPGALIGLQVNLIENPRTFITRFTVYFEAQPDGTLKVRQQDEIGSISPVYMFEGCKYVPEGTAVNIDDLKIEFSQRDIKDIIFAHEVTYPQYPKSLNAGSISPTESEIIEEITRLKAMPGFSFEDPSDLCLVHIFVDDTHTQSLAIHESPTYLPRLNG